MSNHVKYLSFLLGICLPFFAVSQEALNKKDAAGKKQGHWIKLDGNQKKIYDGNFINDIPTGKFTYYYDSGIEKAVTYFSKNGTIARTKMYNPGGKLMGEGKYVNEKKDSIWKYYDDEGVLLSQEAYANGKKNGESRVFYRNGQPAEIKVWKDDVLNGPRTTYFEGGEIKYKGQYINGKVEGKVTFYHSTGKIDAEGMYKNDLKDGSWKYYTENGTLKRTDTYVNGYLTSPDPNVIPKEQLEKEKQQYQDFELKNPFDENYSPN